MKRKLLAVLLVVSMIFSFAACGSDDAEATADTSETTIFVDDAGREVEVPGEITRIVPSGPLAQIILFSIAPDRMVGLSTEWYDSARGIIDDTYFELPCFGQLYSSADLNVEELALADPQLIIDIGMVKDTVCEDLDTLEEQTNIPSVFISASLETMPETYRTLGKLLGEEEKAEELALFCEKVYDRTISIMEEVGDNKVDALYLQGEDGLSVLAKDSYHAELVDLLTNNLAAVDSPAAKGTGNEVTMEQISLWDPEFIIFAPGSIYNDVSDMETWGELDAIANDNYVEVPDAPHNWMGIPPSVQRYLGLIWLTAELYPTYCDYDVKADIVEYYRLFYGCELTDAQYEELTVNAFIGE